MTWDHWLTRGVVYEVFVRAFSDQGTFRAVTEQLGAIRDLGATTVWLMPIHPVGRERRKGTLGSPYAVSDHGAINPDYGTDDDLRRLVDRAHSLGLRVIIDWVANHTAWDNPLRWSNPEFYRRDESGQVMEAGHGWTDVAQLDHSSPGLRDHLIAQMLHWVQGFGIDGFRCDVASLVPVEFWDDAVQTLRQVRPDLGMLAEAYSPALMERAFQLTYDGPWFRGVTQRLLAGKGAERMWDKHDQFAARFPARAQRMRFLDNHDQHRLIGVHADRTCLAAATLLLTSEGVPLIYNGQEIGSDAPSAAPALFERHPIDWRRPRREFRQHYRELCHLRATHPALGLGTTVEIESDEHQLVTFLRTHGDDAVFVGINFSPETVTCEVRDERLGAERDRLHEHAVLAGHRARAGCIDLTLGPWGHVVSSLGPA
jgi:glycosidase